MAQTVASGLSRKAVTSCWKWATKYRVMGNPFPGKWTGKYHPWLLEMHDPESEEAVGQKAAQMGFTEWAMNTAFYCMDVKALDVLYILPTSDDATEFSSGRFDPALELSEHLRYFFSDVNNVKQKRAGTNLLYVRGSKSRSKLKSIPVPVMIYDEVDEMPETSISLAEERQSGQVGEVISLFLSTPTIEDFGINKRFKLSTEEYYNFKCPCCGRLIELEFPDSLVVIGESLTDPRLAESYLKCIRCEGKLPVEIGPRGEALKPWLKHKRMGGTGHFVPSHTNRDSRGFHVNQFYSMAKVGNPVKLAYAKIKADLDPTSTQEWWNSKGGKTFEAPGARVTEEQITQALGAYLKGPSSDRQGYVTMGIDVGAVLHIEIKEFKIDQQWRPGISINDLVTPRVLYEGTTSGKVTIDDDDFKEALELFMQYGCLAVVVDAEPERRAATRFVHSLWGRAYLCDYLYSQSGREVQINKEEATLKVNRTSWMDLALGRFKSGNVKIPGDSSLEYRKHIKAPVRVLREDKWGAHYGVYVNEQPDHFAHADTYAEIALPLAVSLARNQDIMDLY